TDDPTPRNQMNGTHAPKPPATVELSRLDAAEEVDAQLTGAQPDLGEIEARDAESLRGITFPVTWRGDDVHAVDQFVERVEAWITRFQQAHSPTEAVRAALDRVGEQTTAILREAERSAEETTRASRSRADDRLQRAERESEALWAAAQARVRGLDDDIERLWEE